MSRCGVKLFVLMCSLALASCKNDRVPEGFQVEKGFSMELVAGEPLVRDPVDMAFDEKGKCYVLEMPGYPFEDAQSRVVVLHDRDRDGQYDSSSVFSENLQMASSIMPYKKGLLVAAPPYLLHLQDTDLDQKADVVDTLMGGFSTGNLQHNYNGLTWGLDNYIYAVNGGNSGKPYWWGDTTSRVDLRGNDFRFNPETKTLEILGQSSGGFGLAMDGYGRMFETHNLEHISHLVFPVRYRKGYGYTEDRSLPVISDHEENGLARIYPIGEQESRVNHPEQSGYFSGSCGVTYYDGHALGPELKGTVWVADVVLNLLHVDRLEADGSSFQAKRLLERRDFMASTDRSFRPVNMEVGPDGALYVLDMHRKVIEHPEWIPDDVEKNLDIEAGKDQGRIYRITRSGFKASDVDFTQFESTERLISALTQDNGWVMKTAHRLLMERELEKEQIQNLRVLRQSNNALTRVRAYWILSGKQLLSVSDLLEGLKDVESGVRENVLKIAELQLNKDDKLISAVLSLFNDNDSRVRMQAALSLSVLGKEELVRRRASIVQALVASTALPLDEWNTSAMVLVSRHFPDQLLAGVMTMPERNKTFGLVAALSRACGASPELVTGFLNASTKFTGPQLNNFMRAFAEGFQTSESDKGLKLSAQDVEILSEIEEGGDEETAAIIANIRRKADLPMTSNFIALSKRALKILADSAAADSLRIRQFPLIEFIPFKEKADVLFGCLGQTQPLKIQELAARQLAGIQDPAIGNRIVDMWKDLGPALRKGLSDLLIYNELHHGALLTGLESGQINIGEMNFDLERRRQLLWWTDNKETQRRAERLFTDSGVTTRKDAIASMAGALALSGDKVKGLKVFENLCSGCHRYGNTGVEVGPILTEINRKSKETILHEILDPNAAVDTRYISHRIDTRDGRVYLGIVEDESDEKVSLIKQGGEKVSISRREIKKFTSLGVSLMMEGLEQSMNQQEMADLLEFLQRGSEK